MTSIPNLHDATLLTITFEWQKASATLLLKTGVNDSDMLMIQAEVVTNLRVPRLQPWGPSSSVNAVSLKALDKGKILSVEMQSGDILEVSCKEVLIKKT